MLVVAGTDCKLGTLWAFASLRLQPSFLHQALNRALSEGGRERERARGREGERARERESERARERERVGTRLQTLEELQRLTMNSPLALNSACTLISTDLPRGFFGCRMTGVRAQLENTWWVGCCEAVRFDQKAHNGHSNESPNRSEWHMIGCRRTRSGWLH